MLKLRNEYLAIIDKENSKGIYSLCKTTSRFVEFMSSDSKLKINNEKIFLDDKEYFFSIKKGKVKDKDQLFYHVFIFFEGEENDINSYQKLLKELKRSLYKDNLIIETLKDDLSFFYSNKAYALIHNVENLMRKFITYFMITNIGKNWINESSPDQIKIALNKSKRKQYIDVLQQLDFIHLGDFLFKPYQKYSMSIFFDKIKNIDIDEKINISDIKKHLPQSNWDKFFKDTVDCNDLYLKTKWKKIYDLRNKIAHTSFFTEEDYLQITSLVKGVTDKLESAFDNIDSIDLHEEEKEILSENIAANVDENIGVFINEWNKLERQLLSLVDTDEYNFLSSLEQLKNDTAIENEHYEVINKLRKIRNKLVHSVGVDIEEREHLPSYIDILVSLNNDVMSTDDAIKKIIKLFKNNIQGKKYNVSNSNKRHDGKEEYWLERQMGISKNVIDIFGFEMKTQTGAKTTFGDWSANYYLFNDNSLSLSRDDDFLPIFGKANENKNHRYSWSGEASPNIHDYNKYGQKLLIDDEENILAIYRFSEDKRVNKQNIVPINFQQESLILAKWNKDGENGLKVKLERKFNRKGWFRCEKNNEGIYTSITIGSPISWTKWIENVRTGEIYFDSGMYQGNLRNYSQWRANNTLWNQLIIKHVS